MVLSIEVPDGYAYVLFTCGMLPSITNILLGGKVMAARKKFNVPLPNLYATPGHHKEADSFNRVQRGHQHVRTRDHQWFPRRIFHWSIEASVGVCREWSIVLCWELHVFSGICGSVFGCQVGEVEEGWSIAISCKCGSDWMWNQCVLQFAQTAVSKKL